MRRCKKARTSAGEPGTEPQLKSEVKLGRAPAERAFIARAYTA